MAENKDLMDKIVSLCKRRGFVFPGSEIYGGMANSWDYGPLGVELKNNIKQAWWKRFVQQRDDMVGIDAALIMNPKVWAASGHLKNFSDPLVECDKCKNRFRSDQLEALLKDISQFDYYKSHKEDLQLFLSLKKCPKCGGGLSSPRQFNLMFRTTIGSVDSWFEMNRLIDALVMFRAEFSNYKGVELQKEVDKLKDLAVEIFHNVGQAEAYFRPETAQAMFVDFKNVLDTSRKQLPFGIAQQGKAFRNEITPGNFIFRTREFEQMEIEYFIRPPQKDEDWNEVFEHWRMEMKNWITEVLGLKWEHVHELEVPKEELAHYSKRTIDFEYNFPFGVSELYGLAYRTDFDLKNHSEASGQKLEYMDPQTNEKFIPHCIEPTWGVDRSVLAVLCEAFDDSNPENIVLHLPPRLAPYKVAVFPLLKNKEQLVGKAREIYTELKKYFNVAWDDRGNVGKRYYSQDEIGTPFCVTVDFDTIEKDGMVTVRDRDTKEQPRIKVDELVSYLSKKLI